MDRAVFITVTLFFTVVSDQLFSANGCGITTHIETGERAASYFNHISQGVNYKQLLTRNPDAFQAGCPYPDAYYSSLCFGGNYHGESEDTHWTPFLNASINYIRRQYPKPWDSATEKLVAFLLGIVQHQVADATWHALGIDQGFLETMGKVDFHGSFSDAHSVGDFGGDVMNVYELDMGYVGLINKWYVPVDDLLLIYQDLYGQPGRIPREVVENCTALLFLGRLGENLGFIDLLYPRIAEQSPFLLDSLNNFYLAGIDDMATWSANVWRRTIAMLDDGTQICDLPYNPIYIRCNNDVRSGTGNVSSYRKYWDDDAFTRAVNRVNLDDINIRQTERGIVLSVSKALQRRILARLKMANGPPRRSIQQANVQPSVVYNTRQSYSRLGEKLLSGDINGDGNDDLVVSAPEFSTADSFQEGRVYIIYGSAGGLPNRNLTIETSANVILNGPRGLNGRFGLSTAILDFNVDGVNDLVISAPSIGSQTLDYFGQVFVYLSNPVTRTLPTSPSVTINCSERYCNLGWSLTTGDINGDGNKDLIIGSPFAPSGGKQRGMVGVFYSSQRFREGDVFTEANFNLRWDGKQDFEWFGFSIDAKWTSVGGTWVAISSPTYRLCAFADCRYSKNDVQSAGQVSLYRATSISSPVATLKGTDDFEQFGFHVGITTYDGQDVLVVSANIADSEDQGTGRLNLTRSGLVRFYRIVANTIEEDPWFELSGDREFDRFGSQVLTYESRADGRSHVVIAAPFRSEDLLSDREGGRVYDLLDAETSGLQANVTYSLNMAKSRFGSSVALVETAGKQQLAIGALHYTTLLARLGGQVAVVDL